MRNRIKRWWIAAAAGILLAVAAVPAYGQTGGSVNVRLAQFPVKINGIVVDNEHAPYPMIVYNDITYIPLTWDMTHALRLDTQWSDADGLEVWAAVRGNLQGFVPEMLKQDRTASNNMKGAYTARKASYPIKLGQRMLGGITAIDNAKEPFPVLEFRDVTYVPLTWRFAHDLLGLRIGWSSDAGLELDSLQFQVMQRFNYDDDGALYFYSGVTPPQRGSALRLDKSLASKPVWTDKADPVSNFDLVSGRRPKSYTNVSAEIGIQDGKVTFRGAAIDVDKSRPAQADPVSKNNVTAIWFPMKGDQGLLSLKLEPVLPPGAVLVHELFFEAHLYWVNGNDSKELKGYHSVPQQVIANPDGSYWIMTGILKSTDGQEIYRPYNYHHGQLALIRQDGSYKLVNDQFDGMDVNVIGLDNPKLDRLTEADGSLMIDVFPPAEPMAEVKSNGAAYRLTTELKADPVWSYERGLMYMGIDRSLYWLDPDSNSITNIGNKKTAHWYDYDLMNP